MRGMTDETKAATAAAPAPARPAAPDADDETPDNGDRRSAARGGDRLARPAPIPRPAPGEVGGRNGPEPTRFGDWESKGRATDF